MVMISAARGLSVAHFLHGKTIAMAVAIGADTHRVIRWRIGWRGADEEEYILWFNSPPLSR